MNRALTLALLLACAAALAAPANSLAGINSLIAPPSACPGQSDASAPNSAQMKAMRCMTNYARAQRGEPQLKRVMTLEKAALEKGADMIRCAEFSHEACGRDFSYWVEQFDYPHGPCVAVGENIAWGSGRLGSVRSIFTAWIHSKGHRANILNGSFRDFGIGLRIGKLESTDGAHVWTTEFGSRTCAGS